MKPSKRNIKNQTLNAEKRQGKPSLQSKYAAKIQEEVKRLNVKNS